MRLALLLLLSVCPASVAIAGDIKMDVSLEKKRVKTGQKFNAKVVIRNTGKELFRYARLSCSHWDIWKFEPSCIVHEKNTFTPGQVGEACLKNVLLEHTLAPGEDLTETISIMAGDRCPKGATEMVVRFGAEPPILSTPIAMTIE